MPARGHDRIDRRSTMRLRRRLAWAYVASLVAVWVALWRFSDAASLPTVIAFGPRWAFALPLLLLLPRPRPVLAPLIAGALVVAGPIMGFVAGGVWAGTVRAAGRPARIMTANLGSRQLVSGLLVALVGRVRPDIVLMQECTTERAGPAFPRDQWWFRENNGLCLASRHPIDEVSVRQRSDRPQHDAFAARYRVRFYDATIDVANLHLDSPREGFTSIVRHGGGLSGVQTTIAQRRAQSRLVRDWLSDADQSAMVVGGDFNAAPEGAIYRESWAHLVNAYSAGGIGWGYTKHEGWAIGARIDHILLGPRWQVQSAWVEASDGSDHRPLVADVVLTR
jgi:endonuclease/exonuclease/phosphatase family metal-dependent hydrolase